MADSHIDINKITSFALDMRTGKISNFCDEITINGRKYNIEHLRAAIRNKLANVLFQYDTNRDGIIDERDQRLIDMRIVENIIDLDEQSA